MDGGKRIVKQTKLELGGGRWGGGSDAVGERWEDGSRSCDKVGWEALRWVGGGKVGVRYQAGGGGDGRLAVKVVDR